MSARERVMMEREHKKRQDQSRHEKQLRAIRDDNKSARVDAQAAHKNQYRTTQD